MRPNQNNKNRQRGRNNNGGRKHVNPLSRNFESNGPDVKVRGNAAHVAEKYLQLARDAQSSGDPILAENYLQHAEHYFRIVAAAQQQMQPRDQFGQAPEVDDDDDFPPINDRFASPEPPQPQFRPPQQEQQPNGFAPEGEEGTEAAAPAAPEGETGDDENRPYTAQQGEGPEGRRHRDRRRRRGRGGVDGSQGNGGNGADPGNAPQPDVGELPAFLTAGGSGTAE
jgi:uncharacterized protein DUF4167